MPKLWPLGTKQDTTSSGPLLPPWGGGMHPDLEKHFDLVERLRDAPASQQETTALAMVRMAPQAIRGFKAEYAWHVESRDRLIKSGRAYDTVAKTPMRPFKLPNHPGFQRLAINAEKAKDYDRAIELCEEAKRQGWNGDWDKRIDRCRTRARMT